MSTKEVYSTIDDFVHCAELAKEAGYDGVEIMGSEGYLINQFIVSKTNKRTDEFGGSYVNSIRLPLEIVRRTRQARSEEHTSEIQSLMRITYAVFCLKKK